MSPQCCRLGEVSSSNEQRVTQPTREEERNGEAVRETPPLKRNRRARLFSNVREYRAASGEKNHSPATSTQMSQYDGVNVYGIALTKCVSVCLLDYYVLRLLTLS